MKDSKGALKDFNRAGKTSFLQFLFKFLEATVSFPFVIFRIKFARRYMREMS